MGAGRVLCDDVLRRRMRTCVLSVSSTVGRSVGGSVGLSIPALRLGTLVPRQKEGLGMRLLQSLVGFGASTHCPLYLHTLNHH